MTSESDRDFKMSILAICLRPYTSSMPYSLLKTPKTHTL